MVYDQEAFVFEGEKEHFGFRDGISQVGPGIRWIDVAPGEEVNGRSDSRPQGRR